MTAAAAGCSAALLMMAGADSVLAVVSGMTAPLGAAVASWKVVERTHRRGPDGVTPVMVKLFAAKMVLFGAYVSAGTLFVRSDATVFAVSLASHFILLHVLEAFYLARLFSAPPRRSALS